MNKQKGNAGIGVAGMLGIVFVVLKLVGVIDWSWWWVTAPFWAGFAIFGGIALFALGMAGVVALFSRR